MFNKKSFSPTAFSNKSFKFDIIVEVYNRFIVLLTSTISRVKSFYSGT